MVYFKLYLIFIDFYMRVNLNRICINFFNYVYVLYLILFDTMMIEACLQIG